MMNSELEQLAEAMPAVRARSRLDPYREVILLWRRQGRSYREIQQVLQERRAIRINQETLRRYVLRRSRPRKGEPEAAASPPVATDRWAAERERMRQHKEGPATGASAIPKIFEYTDEDASKPLYVEPVRRKSQEELIAERDAIRKAYEKRTIAVEAAPEKVFVFDPDKPPVNKYYDPQWCKENGKEQR